MRQGNRTCSCCFHLHPLPRECTSYQRLLANAKFPFKRGHWVSGEYQQHGASSDPLRGALIPPPMGSDALSLGLWPAYFIFAALEQVLQQQQSPSLSWGTLETFCPFHRSENTFSSKKRDWFGTKTAAPHPSNNSLKLHPILHLPLCPGFIAVKVVKSAAGCPVICRIFQMKN